MKREDDDEKMSVFEFFETLIKLVCTVLLISLIVILALQRFSNNNIAVGGLRIFNVATGSMVPVYNIGDIIIVKEVDTNTLQVGDPITYLGKEKDFANRVVTHRIIGIDETEEGKIFHTKGDAATEVDPEIRADQIYGKVVHRCFLLSKISRLMNNLKIFYIFVFLPLGLLIFLQFKDNFTNRILEKKEEASLDDDDDEDEDEDYEEEDEEDEDEQEYDDDNEDDENKK